MGLIVEPLSIVVTPKLPQVFWKHKLFICQSASGPKPSLTNPPTHCCPRTPRVTTALDHPSGLAVASVTLPTHTSTVPKPVHRAALVCPAAPQHTAQLRGRSHAIPLRCRTRGFFSVFTMENSAAQSILVTLCTASLCMSGSIFAGEIPRSGITKSRNRQIKILIINASCPSQKFHLYFYQQYLRSPIPTSRLFPIQAISILLCFFFIFFKILLIYF